MLDLEKSHRVDHLVVNDISQIDIWLCIYTILNINSKREVVTMICLQHLDLFQLFGHGKGNLINCIAQTLIRIINAIVGPTKMHFGERCPIHQPHYYSKKLQFLTIWESRWAFHDGVIEAAWEFQLTQLLLKVQSCCRVGSVPSLGGE